MSDTPDVHDAQWLPADLLWIAPHLHRLSALGYVVVKADGLQHGDELVRLGTTWSSLTGDPPPPPTYVLRRPVPENGERPHTHTRGIDRGDCPECDAEYGDTNG